MSILVGRNAPDFTVPAVLGSGEITDKFNLLNACEGKYGLVFFYPLDFTFVCPSELIALHNRMGEFKTRNVEVVAVSIDSQFTHNAYRNTSVKDGGIGAVSFTMAADITHSICQSYGIEHPTAGVAYRAAFVIDKNGIIQWSYLSPMAVNPGADGILEALEKL